MSVTKIALRCRGHAAHPEVPGKGLFLKDFDFDGQHDERALMGSGKATFTDNVSEAKLFDDMAQLHAFYRTVPERFPTRWDGKPNMPMTGYHWELVTVDTGDTPL